MSGKDAFARGYASANDDIRHHLVERGWFDQTTRDDAMSRDVDAKITQYDQEMSNSAWGRLPDAERQPDPPDYDPYGDRSEPATSGPSEPQRDEFDPSDLYGDGHANEPKRDDLYGPDRDIEQDRD